MRRTKQEARATRDAILDAAEVVFHRRGVAVTSLADIASEASVTRGAIYWHFAGKAELFRAMLERVSAPEEEFFRSRAAAEGGDTLDGLRALLLEMIRRFAADGQSQRVQDILLFRCEYVGEMGDVVVRRRENEDAFERAILETFARAEREGGLGAGWSRELASTALRCAVMGAISDWLRLGRSYDLVEVGASLLDSLFASFARGRTRTDAARGQMRA